jgi:hypothetical protein
MKPREGQARAHRDRRARRREGMAGVDFYRTVFEVIDMRSFSNLWYWIGLAVLWSSVSHWVLGVPWDMLTRARRRGGQAEADFEALVRINVSRLLYIDSAAGLWLVGLGAFLLSSLGIAGFWYRVEFAQAVFLMLAPLVVVGALSLATARAIDRRGLSGEALRRRLARHRLAVQAVGVAAIFVTAMWGMYQNLYVGPWGF